MCIRDRIYSEIICALSYSGSDKSEQTKAQNEVDYDAVIFAAPDLLVLPGDGVSLKRFGRDNPSSQILLSFQVVGRPSLLSLIHISSLWRGASAPWIVYRSFEMRWYEWNCPSWTGST